MAELLLLDLRHWIRELLNHRAFYIIPVMTLAPGISGTTIAFALLYDPDERDRTTVGGTMNGILKLALPLLALCTNIVPLHALVATSFHFPPKFHLPAMDHQTFSDLSGTRDVPIAFQNTAESSVLILNAFVTIVDTEKSRLWPSSEEYPVRAKVSIMNNTDRRTDYIQLHFTDLNGRVVFRIYDRIIIEPQTSVVFAEDRRRMGERIISHQELTQLVVRVAEARFDDGTVWEINHAKEQPSVDAEPVLLRRPNPTYTNEAVLNRIHGSVRLVLLVGTDGKVRNAKIVRGLPYGLNEEAVRAAYKLKFKPASKGGQPVEYPLLFDLQFNAQ